MNSVMLDIYLEEKERQEIFDGFGEKIKREVERDGIGEF